MKGAGHAYREGRGVALGNPNIGTARSFAVAAIKAESDRVARNVGPIIAAVRRSGATTLRQIADALNAREVSDPIKLAIVEGLNVRDSRLSNYPGRWNGAPSQELLVVRENHQTGERSLDLLRWGLIPYWCKDPSGGRKPINAKAETVVTLPTFRDAYRKRRSCCPSIPSTHGGRSGAASSPTPSP